MLALTGMGGGGIAVMAAGRLAPRRFIYVEKGVVVFIQSPWRNSTSGGGRELVTSAQPAPLAPHQGEKGQNRGHRSGWGRQAGVVRSKGAICRKYRFLAEG